MSLEARSSAHFKRAEQLRRWEDSETNREPTVPKVKAIKVQFSPSCAFLGACSEGDKEEILKLLQKGIDINTTNVDGLTALHQACIEDNLDMVEFLVQNGADVNLGDNEGWTPLHATASCGLCSIAKYLIDNGADVAAINNDGELAIDIAESEEMENLLQEELQKRGIDCELARGEEQRRMLQDARDWVAGNTNDNTICIPDPKTGATALHIAAAKGYTDVMHILLQNDLIDVDQQDCDGWTPLHAAAHWGQRDAAKLLVDNLADMEIKNYYKQTPFDVADQDMLKLLEDLKVKQSSLNREIVLGKRQAKQKSNAPAKIKKVELEIEKDKENENEDTGALDNHVVEKKNRVNAAVTSPTTPETNRIYPPTPAAEQNSISRPPPQTQAPTLPPKTPDNIEDVNAIPSWRRPASFRSRIGNESPTKSPLTLRIGDKEQRSPTSPTARNADSDVVLRRTHSFENDENKEPTSNIINTTTSPPLTPTVTVSTANTTSPNKTTGSPTATSPQPNTQVRRSFVPPVRDEESETQRKAHAKRVRETRRSTQGVTLDEIKSAEQLVKKKNQSSNVTPVVNNSSEQQNSTDITTTTAVINNTTSNGDTTNITPSVSATITTGTPTVVSRETEEQLNNVSHERRPSWRLRVDNGSKFKLEDANVNTTASPTVFVRRTGSSQGQISVRPSSAPVESSVPPSPPTDAVVTLPLRRNAKSLEDKEQDKENDVRNAQATQAVIQRRRRPKRRSTGVVHVDMDEIDPDKQDTNAGGDYDEPKVNHQESGSEEGAGRTSRLGSTSDGTSSRNENGEIDYKKLWEQSEKERLRQQTEIERLREKLHKEEEDHRQTKSTVEKLSAVQTNKTTLSEMEKREKRAMERKLSEMEEELKQLQKLKAENERLRAENRALTRVVSKLTNTAATRSVESGKSTTQR